MTIQEFCMALRKLNEHKYALHKAEECGTLHEYWDTVSPETLLKLIFLVDPSSKKWSVIEQITKEIDQSWEFSANYEGTFDIIYAALDGVYADIKSLAYEITLQELFAIANSHVDDYLFRSLLYIVFAKQTEESPEVLKSLAFDVGVRIKHYISFRHIIHQHYTLDEFINLVAQKAQV